MRYFYIALMLVACFLSFIPIEFIIIKKLLKRKTERP